MWNSKKIDLLAVRHFPLGAARLFIAVSARVLRIGAGLHDCGESAQVWRVRGSEFALGAGAGFLTPPTPSTAGLPEWLVRSP